MALNTKHQLTFMTLQSIYHYGAPTPPPPSPPQAILPHYFHGRHTNLILFFVSSQDRALTQFIQTVDMIFVLP